MVFLFTALALALVLSGIDYAAIQVRKAFGRLAGNLVWLLILPVAILAFIKISFLAFVLGVGLSAFISTVLIARLRRKGPWGSSSSRSRSSRDNDDGFDFGGDDD